MNGRKLVDAARERRPSLKVLFTTGYARNAIVHEGRLDPGVQLITKPFSYVALAAKLREILDSGAGPTRVLVIDDEPLVRLVAVDTLDDLGFAVLEAGTAVEALNHVRGALGRSIAAAVVDIGLPDRRGDSLAAELRALNPDLAIVIASGRSDAALREQLGRLGRLRILVKPYDPEQLAAVLAELGVRPKA